MVGKSGQLGTLSARQSTMTKTLFVTTAAVLLTASCAEHRVPRAVGDPSLPSLGWVIMHGHKDNPDEEFGCQSAPRSPCTVHASTAAGQTLSEVHLYFHAGRTEARYSGTVKIGFFRSSESLPAMKTDATVKAGDVGNQSVVGIVRDKPGRYIMRIDVTATTEAGGEQRIREDVPIDVQAPPSRSAAN